MGGQTELTACVPERKTRLDGTSEVFLCDVLLLEPGTRAVLRYELDRDWTIAATGLVVPRGAVTVSHYWMDRPYNVYHWLQDGRTLAYYCNVAEQTEISSSLVAYTDLVLDVLLRPPAPAVVLDEEDLPADLAPRHRALVASALEALADPRRLVREVEAETRRLL